MSTQRVFVTGVAGYVGGHTVMRILEKHPEWSVCVLVRNEEQKRIVLSRWPGLEILIGDLDDKELLISEGTKSNVVLQIASADHIPGVLSLIKGLSKRNSPGYFIHVAGTGTLNDVPKGFAAMGLSLNTAVVDLAILQPTIEQSNVLCKIFFESVNPFIKVLHQSHFGIELQQYRRGTFLFPREFEALLFSIYVLAVNSIRSEIVEMIFATPKCDMVDRFQNATQMALAKVDFFKTDKIATFQATIHYLTFLFQRNVYRDAVSLLGTVVRLAQNFGLHRDPSNFPYSPWVSSIRRRAWNHVCCLNALALGSYGIESCLPPTSDTIPPQNSNVSDWHASRLAKPSSVPHNISGFKERTFALANREISDLTVDLSKLDTNNFIAKEDLIRNTEKSIHEKYLNYVDRSNHSQTIVAAFVEIRLSSLRLTLSYQKSKEARPESRDAEKYQTFLSAIRLLEANQYHCMTFSVYNWDWVFQSVVPWLPIAIILTRIPKANQPAHVDRAQKQIQLIFSHHSELSNPVNRTPTWYILVQLRGQMEGQWLQPHGSPSFGKQSAFSEPRVDQRFNQSSLTFTDNAIMDFDAVAEGDNQIMYDEPFTFQEMHDLLWLNTQMQLGFD